MSDKTVLPTPEIMGSLLNLPEHVQSVIKAYGDARERVALHNARAVLAASEDRRDAEPRRLIPVGMVFVDQLTGKREALLNKNGVLLPDMCGLYAPEKLLEAAIAAGKHKGE